MDEFEERELKKLRDTFATYALLGLIQRGFKEFGNSESAYAEQAFKIAEAMMIARNQ